MHYLHERNFEFARMSKHRTQLLTLMFKCSFFTFGRWQASSAETIMRTSGLGKNRFASSERCPGVCDSLILIPYSVQTQGGLSFRPMCACVFVSLSQFTAAERLYVPTGTIKLGWWDSSYLIGRNHPQLMPLWKITYICMEVSPSVSRGFY